LLEKPFSGNYLLDYYEGSYAMKYRLIGVAALAALSISEPARAQQAGTAAPSAQTAPAAAVPKHVGSPTRAHHRRHAVQSAKHPSTKSTANQLNKDELSHFQSTNQMPTGGPPTSSRGMH
jgi:hypothetical protein